MDRKPLATVLPPLIFGTATFNTQYNANPYALGARELVARALELGVRAFDTSPYYGPSESILGHALDTEFVQRHFPREDVFLLTKVGRIASDRFDYSPPWVRASVQRSLERLRTPYLDVVYCHDVEFVSADQVVGAVRELRRLRDQRLVRYVGISGYPVETLCSLAERVLQETGEPLDAVMSYANYTLQNQRLFSHGVGRLRAAGVSVVPNASILGMGLLRRDGVPVGGQGDWHPAPTGLRQAIREASDALEAQDERLEKIAMRWAMERWTRDGAPVGARNADAPELSHVPGHQNPPLGITVMGVSSLPELEETISVWRSILDALGIPWQGTPVQASDRAWSAERSDQVQRLACSVREMLGRWADVAWDSPPAGFVNQGPQRGGRRAVETGKAEKENTLVCDAVGQLPTPAATPN